MLSNIYLHHVLDEWFEGERLLRRATRRGRGARTRGRNTYARTVGNAALARHPQDVFRVRHPHRALLSRRDGAHVGLARSYRPHDELGDHRCGRNAFLIAIDAHVPPRRTAVCYGPGPAS